MKRLLFIVSALLLLTVVSTEAKPKKLTSTITWELQKDGTLVIKGTGKMPDFDKSEDVPWWGKRKKINAIQICEGITHIGENCFAHCHYAKTIAELPSTLKTIGDKAFLGSPIKKFIIPNGVIGIGHNVFSYNSAEEIVINCNIPKDAFFYDNFKKVTIGNEVTRIETGAFRECKIGSIFVPKSVTFIGDKAFEDCSGELIIDSKIIETDYDYDSEPIKSWLYGSKFTKLTIGDNITKIGKRAFEGCKSLASVTIPNSVTEIGEDAFKSCSSLTSISISNSVSEIGKDAFAFCSSLTSITIPNSVTKIGFNPFTGCHNLKTFYGKYASSDNRCLIVGSKLISFAPAGLTKYTIPNSVTEIGEDAFAFCSSLTSVTIPNSVTKIKDYAFCYCSSLTSVTIPNSVTKIEWCAFEGCESLASVTIPNSVTKIESFAFCSCSSLTSVTIPNSVTKIESFAFKGCSSLTSITIPNSVTKIESLAFKGCSSLTSITIPNSVTKIGEETFYGCSSLTSVSIPNSVTEIGKNAFRVSENKEYNGKITNLPACVTRENYSKFGISKEAFETYMDNIGDPTAAVLREKGKVYFDAKDYKTALSYCLKGVAAKKDGALGFAIPACYMMAGSCYEHLNDYVNAIKYYKTFYELIKDASAANMIGELYLKLNDYNSAIEWYKKGSKSNKEIAELYLKKNNYSGAIEMLSKDAEKGDKDCQYMLAEVYKKSGNKNKAIFWYKKAAEQKHIKAEEALADYGVFLTQVQPQQQSQSKKSPEQTTQNTTIQPYTPPQIQYRQVWVDCQHCNGGRCIKCDGYGNSYSAGGRWHSCVHCYQGRCMWCEGRGGRYETRMY